MTDLLRFLCVLLVAREPIHQICDGSVAHELLVKLRADSLRNPTVFDTVNRVAQAQATLIVPLQGQPFAPGTRKYEMCVTRYVHNGFVTQSTHRRSPRGQTCIENTF